MERPRLFEERNKRLKLCCQLAKEHLGHQKLEKARKDSSPEPSKGAWLH